MKPISRTSANGWRLLAMILVAGSGAALADAGALDGKRFDGVFIERGKTSGDADTIVFKDGRMRSAACDRYGYADAPYKATAGGDGIAFEAETESPKYGRLVWRGVVRGGKLDATATMLRQGKPPVENWVVGASKP